MERLNKYQSDIFKRDNLTWQSPIIWICSWILISFSQPVFSQSSQIIVSEPLNYSVARPLIHFKAGIIAGTDHYHLNIYAGNTLLGSYLDSIDTDLDLTAYEGGGITLFVQATNQNNQTVNSAPVTVYVESSHFLQEYASAPGQILDFNYNKMMIVDDGSPSNPRTMDVAGGNISAIPYNGNPRNVYISPQGVVFAGSTGDSLYDYNNGILNSLGTMTPGTMKVAGNYCLWAKASSMGINDSLFLRDLAGGTNTLVASNAPHTVDVVTFSQVTTTTRDVADNGTVVYMDSTQNIISFASNNYTTISADGTPAPSAFGNSNPITDGYNIAYQMLGPYLVVVMTGDDEALWGGLRGAPMTEPKPGSFYQLNNKCAGYMSWPGRNPPTRYAQVMARDSLGNTVIIQQTEVEGGDVPYRLDLLNPKGDLMFFSAGRNLAVFNKPSIRISSTLGTTYYRDSSWYIAIGRMLYKLNLNPTPDLINNSSITIARDSTHTFKTTDFTAHFTGSGQLLSVQITGLTSKGKLYLSGNPVKVLDQIARADLDKLTYTPDSGSTSTDTLRWNAYDGFTYTPADAMIFIHIILIPEKPVLEGLKSNYCIKDTTQKIKIINLPDNSNGINTSVKLDATQLAVIKADSSFFLNPGGLSIGEHTLVTTFTNIVGASMDTEYLSVQATITPIVKLSADIAHVNSLSNPVTLTATNTTGGGAKPEYIFAKDRNFTVVLQNQSYNNKLIISPKALLLGNNWIYVQMKSSETCNTVQTASDSTNIQLEPMTGISDPEFPSQLISVNPNPFSNQIIISGLHNEKSYQITLYQASGKEIFSVQIMNQTGFDFTYPNLSAGVYLLRIYDMTKKSVLGSLKLINE